MAFDRSYDEADGSTDAHPETDTDSVRASDAAPAESAEPRSREEYYEMLRAADGDEADDASERREETADDVSAGDDVSADAVHDESGDGSKGPAAEVDDRPVDIGAWKAVDVEERPPMDAIGVDAERATHILDGDPGGGGGHRHGVGRPRKTEFPAAWDDENVLSNVVDVARRPDAPPVLQDRNNRWICTGTRDGVEISVILLRSGEVWTAWPEEGGPGVVRNPRRETL